MLNRRRQSNSSHELRFCTHESWTFALLSGWCSYFIRQGDYEPTAWPGMLSPVGRGCTCHSDSHMGAKVFLFQSIFSSPGMPQCRQYGSPGLLKVFNALITSYAMWSIYEVLRHGTSWLRTYNPYDSEHIFMNQEKPKTKTWFEMSYWAEARGSTKRAHFRPSGDSKVKSVKVANRIANRVSYLMRFHRRKKVHYILENPLSSILWRFKAIKRTLKKHNAIRVVAHMGAYGSDTLKPVSW